MFLVELWPPWPMKNVSECLRAHRWPSNGSGNFYSYILQCINYHVQPTGFFVLLFLHREMCYWSGKCFFLGCDISWPLSSFWLINPLTPNDPYRGRAALLTSKRCILYIYSSNIGTGYFKHGIVSPFFFSLQNAVCFIIPTYLAPALFTFYIQGVLKLKK